MGRSILDWGRIDPRCGCCPPASAFPSDLQQRVDQILPILNDVELLDELAKAVRFQVPEMCVVCDKIQAELERRCPLCLRRTEDLKQLFEIYVHSRKYHPFDGDINEIVIELQKRESVAVARTCGGKLTAERQRDGLIAHIVRLSVRFV